MVIKMTALCAKKTALCRRRARPATSAVWGKGKDSRADGQRKDEQDALTEAIRGLAARRLLCAEGRAADGLEALAEADDGRGERHDRAGAQPHARQDGRAEFGGYA